MKSAAGLTLQIFRLLTLFLFAIAAHEWAGGELISTPRLLLEMMGLILLLVSVKNQRLEGPSLALLVLLIQSTSHFILGGGDKTSEMQMSSSHIVSGLFSYLVISKIEILWQFIQTLISTLILPKVFTHLSPKNYGKFKPTFSADSFQIIRLVASLKYRGPPRELSI